MFTPKSDEESRFGNSTNTKRVAFDELMSIHAYPENPHMVEGPLWIFTFSSPS